MTPNNQQNEFSSREAEGETVQKIPLYDYLRTYLRKRLGEGKFPEHFTVFDCGLFHGHLDFRELFDETISTDARKKSEDDKSKDHGDETNGADKASPVMEIEATVNTGEEHRTAALMGLISAHLSWYRTLGELAGADVFPECRWGATTRNQEARNGADFGIVIELKDDQRPTQSVRGTDAPAEKMYNVAYFQAKLEAVRVTPDIVNIEVSQPPTGYKSEDGIIKKNADTALASWGISEELDENLNPQEQHQIVKLAIMDALLRKRDDDVVRRNRGAEHSYVHYAAWRRTDADALVVPLDTVRKFGAEKHNEKIEKQKKENAKPFKKNGDTPIEFSMSSYTFEQLEPSFPAFVSSGQTQSSDGWASITKSEIEKVIKEWPILGTSWMIVESSGGGLINVLRPDSKDSKPAPVLEINAIESPKIPRTGFTRGF